MSLRLNLTADEVLTTTRSVRKRLDFDRPVEREVLEECLEIAMQAPTGSNSQGWAWVVVEDADKKKAIADFYGKNFDVYANSPARRSSRATTCARRRPTRSGRRPPTCARTSTGCRTWSSRCIRGRVDNDVPGATSAASGDRSCRRRGHSCSRLRERGLGSAWTTLHLPNEKEVAELLGIPYDKWSQAGLFPIAYTIGTDFKPAKRLPLETFVHWDTW